MKNRLNILVAVGAIVAAGSATANTGDVQYSLGADYLHTWVKGQDSSGIAFSKLPKSLSGGTVYLGTKVLENLGLELGFDWSKKKSSNWVNGADSFRSNLSRNGFHLDMLGILPVSDSFDIFASLGFSLVKSKFNATNVSVTNGISTTTTLTSKGKATSIARLGAGVSYMFTEMFGARAKVGWENTSAIRYKDSRGTLYKPYKDSITAACGVFVKF